MIQIEMYGDLSCPFAYVVHAKWRRLRHGYAGRVQLQHRSLALEYVNEEPTPMRLLEVELPLLMAGEPDIPYAPWAAPDSEWPVTIWPAFEAVKCAEKQSVELAEELAWSIRTAFFGESRCISMRHLLLELAERVGVDMTTFVSGFDSGSCRSQVIEEARTGWERLNVPGSPTWVLPDGRIHADFGLPEIDVDARFRPAIRGAGGEGPERRVQKMRELIDQELARAANAG